MPLEKATKDADSGDPAEGLQCRVRRIGPHSPPDPRRLPCCEPGELAGCVDLHMSRGFFLCSTQWSLANRGTHENLNSIQKVSQTDNLPEVWSEQSKKAGVRGVQTPGLV